MAPISIAEHPAPWPLLDLDMAAMRTAGHQSVPFRQFILKVHSRCNLSCSYCYVYEMADQAWRHMPKRMSREVAQKAVERIAEHVEGHGLESVDIIFHGGEPLLAGAPWLADLAAALSARVPAQVNLAMQTNGTLLERPMLETLKSLRVQVGVSLDGDAEATGRYRRYANGHNSFGAVADGLYLLDSPEFRECYSGILCTIDVDNDPIATYEALLKFNPPAIDFLLPHANWSCPPPGTGYADWLISVFERWYSAPRQETRIRFFSELVQLVLGQPGAVEGLGLLPSTVVVVDTDGAIKQLDSLSSAYPGAADIGLHVDSGSFDDALEHPTTIARQIGVDALSEQCRACPVMEICGGGLYPHRYRRGAGFRNPSVYCADLRRLITHVRDRIIADVRDLKVLYVGLDFRGQPGPVPCCPGLGMLQGKSLLVPAEHVGESLLRVGFVSRGGLVDSQIRLRDQGVRVIIAECPAAFGQRLLADMDGFAQLVARGQVGCVVDRRRQREGVQFPVYPDEPPHSLLVVSPCLFGTVG